MQLTDGDPAKAAAERRCEPGFFCVGGIKALCDPGTWGGEFGLVSFHRQTRVVMLCLTHLIMMTKTDSFRCAYVRYTSTAPVELLRGVRAWILLSSGKHLAHREALRGRGQVLPREQFQARACIRRVLFHR